MARAIHYLFPDIIIPIEIFTSTSLLSQPGAMAKQLAKELFGIEELKNSNFSGRSGGEDIGVLNQRKIEAICCTLLLFFFFFVWIIDYSFFS